MRTGSSRLSAALAVAALLAACAAPAQRSGGALFGLIGDVPYSQAQANLLDAVIDRMNAEPLAFVVHVGDITGGEGPCSDDWMGARERQFRRWNAPVVLLPGDNEWTDCHRSGMDPMERLAAWRARFCFRDARLAVERQPGEYCEHLRWVHERVMFVALNIPGSNNNLGRTAAMDAEHERRMAAVFQWLGESIATAEARGLAGVAIFMQANPGFESGGRRRPGQADGFSAFREFIAAQTASRKLRFLLVHGDTHNFRDDRPLPSLRRVEVHGSPNVRWTRAWIDPTDARFFVVEPAAP